MKPLALDSKAFIGIEIILTLAILGILGTILFKATPVQEKICVFKITKNIQDFQTQMASTFTKAYFENAKLHHSAIQEIFQPYALSHSKHCTLALNAKKSIIIARSYKEQTSFQIVSNNLSTHPQIKCSLNSKLCKKFHNRMSNK